MHMKKLPGQPLEKVAVQRHVSALREQGGFPDWWAPLYELACNRTIFLSREWLENWLELYGSGFTGTWVHWSCNGRVVGGCLLLTRPIRIGAMSITTTESTLQTGFAGYGTIVAHSIDRNAFGQSLGVGHVEYSTEQAGTNAIAAKHNTVFDGATIEVTEDR